MRVVIVRQKWFAGQVLDLVAGQAQVAAVLGTDGPCRFTEAAARRSIPVVGEMHDIEQIMRENSVDLLIAAHATRFVPASVRNLARAAIGYHPSFLPQHRGRRAVQATIEAGDAVVGGTVFRLTDGWDEGPIAFQGWRFVEGGTTAGDLWRQELAPLGLDLIREALAYFALHGSLPRKARDKRFVTVC